MGRIATDGMRASVVVSTCDRARYLATCLKALEYQSYRNFEVIVVVGPTRDGTDDVLSDYADRVRVMRCPDRNLSRSRNIGIDASSGEIVAFIDDDSIGHRHWLRDLVAAYEKEDIGGVGGLVYDHTGRALQYRYSSCTRYGRTRFSFDQPFPESFCEKRADPFIYLQGTNASFRRDVLVEIGGFNEQISYFHDETDVCLHVIDAGYRLVALDKAVVFHKYAASALRDFKRIVLHPYQIVRSQHIFVLQNGKGYHLPATLHFELDQFVSEVRATGISSYRSGDMTSEQLHQFGLEVDLGAKDGKEVAEMPRPKQAFAAASPESFVPFSRLGESPDVLRVCFVSQEYPPDDYGGIGRFTYDLANGFAAHHHDVHVVTHADGPDRTDFIDGVWVHCLSNQRPIPSAVRGDVLQHNYRLLASNYSEIERLAADEPLDIVSAPIWNVEGALIACDERFPTVLTLMTPLKAVVEMHPSWERTDQLKRLLALEGATFRQARNVHAISRAILENMQQFYGPAQDARVVPLAVRDLASFTPRSRLADDGRVVVLFVGRLERRKGVDILLQACVDLLEDLPFVEVHFVGKDTPNTEMPRTYRETFQNDPAVSDAIKARVHFAGAVSESELSQAYADADIFCLPSRYESFGLVLLEAMTFGLPLVASRVGGMAEIVTDGREGTLFEVGDVRGLTAALKSLATDAALRRRMAQAARATFEERFALPVIVPATIEFYGAVSRAHRGHVTSREDVARKFARLVDEAGLTNGRDALLVSRSLVGLADESVAQPPRRSLRALARKTLRRIYHASTRVPVVGGVAHETAGFYRTYRRAQNFLGSNEQNSEVRAHVEHVRWMVDSMARSTSQAKFHAARDREEMLEQLAQIETRLRKVEERAASILAEMNSSTAIAALGQRMEFIRNELMFEMRELRSTQPGLAQNQLVSLIKDEMKITGAEHVRLNVGCGHDIRGDMINVDRRDLPGVDIVADAADIPLPPSSVSEIFSSHLMEHFPIETLRRTVLPHWKSLLAPGGTLRAIVPDGETMLASYGSGQYSFDDLREVLFGLQEYEGDFHFNMFSRETLKNAVEDCGFVRVGFSFTGRRNGKCFDMEIVGFAED